MKAARIFFVVVAMLAIAIFPSAEKPVVAQASHTIMVTSPVQVFLDAARGMPLLASMNITAPLITLSVESASDVPGYACTLVSQKPKNYTRMVSRQDFDMIWTVKNSGAHTWHAGAVVLKYISGTKMQTHGNKFGLSSDLVKNRSATLVVDMNAPKGRGIYSALWGLYASKNPFCKFNLIVNVTR